MKRKALAILSVSFLVSAAVSCTTARTRSSSSRHPASEPPSTLTVVALTDFHGAIEPELIPTAAGGTVISGGAATLSSYIKILREKTPGPLVILDGGDLFQGTMVSNTFEGAPVIKFYNYLGVHAAALGNHEFDFGPVGDKAVPRDPGDDAQGALKERMREADFPILAVNVIDEKTGKTPSWIKRSIVVEQQGIKIGIIGASAVDTPTTTNAANLAGLQFIPELEPIREEALRLRNEEKVQSVVLAILAGGGCKNNDHQDDLKTCESGEGYDLIHQLPEGLVDVVVAGHTHKGVAKRIKKTVMLQPFSRGKQLGWAEVNLRNPTEKPRVAGWVSVCGSVVKTDRGPTCIADAVRKSKAPVESAEFLGVKVVPDAEVDELLKPEMDKVQAMKEQPLNINALDVLTRKYYGENALGNLVADALKESLPGTDVGMTNGGGLRADVSPGPLKYVHVFDVLPFDNQLAKITVDGATLRKMVVLGHAGGKGGLSWSGLNYAAQGCKVNTILVNGKRLNPDATYTIATSDYLATGGSGFNTLKLKPEQIEIYWDRPMLMREAAARILRKWGRDLRSTDYFDPEAPRNPIDGDCQQ